MTASPPVSPAANRVEILPVPGIGEIRPGADLADEISRNAPWLADGDILVVTSKIVSKAEGRLVPAETDDEAEREAIRQQAIADETVRVVARRGQLAIVETRQGLVMAAAGVDASNVIRSEIALLPLDPDDSARRLREAIIARTGRNVAVVISDSMGRPWRHGISDVAIGVAGMTAVTDERGTQDRHGNTLIVTEVAIADEVASAGDLVKGKLGHVPVAVVRGLAYGDDGRGSKLLIRGSQDDLFRLGTNEAIALGQAQASGGADQVDVSGLHAEALACLTALRLDAGDGTGQAAVREGFYALLAARPDATRRSCAPGHLTASTVLLDHEARRVLLTLHPRVGAWLQLGGHCEDDDVSLVAAAAREALEESGIGGIRMNPAPVDLDIHPITCSLGIPTRHFDVRFVGLAPAGAQEVISAESDDLRWFDLDALPDNIAPELPALIARAAAASRW
ncbi:MAG: coenzyme F420-0:L-glutamate ligase [Frankiales bacterium]|nr:coenzyme F420-0:L-glutamate ligase [Frankiales bacterium]